LSPKHPQIDENMPANQAVGLHLAFRSDGSLAAVENILQDT